MALWFQGAARWLWGMNHNYPLCNIAWGGFLWRGFCLFGVGAALCFFRFFHLKINTLKTKKQCAVFGAGHKTLTQKTAEVVARGRAKNTGVFEGRKIWVFCPGDWAGHC